METYPNQRIVLIQRTSDKSRKNYFKISNKNLFEAINNLKANAFKLYIYLCDNSNQYKLALSSKNFCDHANISNKTYQNAFDELLEKGYLIKHKSNSNIFLFIESIGKTIENKKDIIVPVDKNDISFDEFLIKE